MQININSYIEKSFVEGPGARFVIWVQGCSIKCKGCANKHMWDKNEGTFYDTEDIIRKIENVKDKIEGITFLGGEPVDQIDAIIEIAKAAQGLGLSVLIFTGYEYPNLKNNKKFHTLVKYTDILIDGKYEKEKHDISRPWVGSTNQKYYFLSNRYDENIFKYKNKIEIRIKNNEITLNGMGNFKDLTQIL